MMRVVQAIFAFLFLSRLAQLRYARAHATKQYRLTMERQCLLMESLGTIVKTLSRIDLDDDDDDDQTKLLESLRDIQFKHLEALPTIQAALIAELKSLSVLILAEEAVQSLKEYA